MSALVTVSRSGAKQPGPYAGICPPAAVPAFLMRVLLCVPLYAVAQAQLRSPRGENMLKKQFTARTTCYKPITGSPPACHEESQCVSDLCGFGCMQLPQLVKNICSLKIGDAIYYSGFLLTTDLKSLGISHLWSFQGCVFDAASEDCRGKSCLFLFSPYLCYIRCMKYHSGGIKAIIVSNNETILNGKT